MRRLSPLLLVLAVGCGPSPTTQSPQVIYDVGWLALVRDQNTVHAYTGHRVRIRLDVKEYRVDGKEIKVWAGDRAAPPVLVFAFEGTVGEGNIIVIGTCQAPVRDGIWRSPRHDFYVNVTDCIVTGR